MIVNLNRHKHLLSPGGTVIRGTKVDCLLYFRKYNRKFNNFKIRQRRFYRVSNINLMRIWKTVNNIKKNPSIERWNYWFGGNRNYSSSSNFEYDELRLMTNFYDKKLQIYLSANAEHLQFFQHQIIKIGDEEFVKVVAYQITDNPLPVKILGETISVVEIKDGQYICKQGIEFQMEAKKFLDIFPNYRTKIKDENILYVMPEYLNNLIKKEELLVLNIHTKKVFKLEDFIFTPLVLLEEVKNEFKDINKKD